MKWTRTRTAWRIAGILALAEVAIIGIGAYRLRPHQTMTPFGGHSRKRGLSAYLSHPHPPFAFLQGARVVPDKNTIPGSPYPIQSINGIDYLSFGENYAMPADFATVRAQAERELLAQGFKRTRADKSMGPFSVEYRRALGPNGDHIDDDWITIYKDMRYRTGLPSEPYTIVGDDAKGWTSLQVSLSIRLSPMKVLMHQ